MAANVVFYFKSFDELEAFAEAHPELWINVLGLTAKGWYKALVSKVEANNSVEPEPTVPTV